jgi:hypothetical protein
MSILPFVHFPSESPGVALANFFRRTVVGDDQNQSHDSK